MMCALEVAYVRPRVKGSLLVYVSYDSAQRFELGRLLNQLNLQHAPGLVFHTRAVRRSGMVPMTYARATDFVLDCAIAYVTMVNKGKS